jgi:methanogenic corrinoid protein MtbC1
LDELIADSQPSREAADPYLAVRERFIEAVGAMDVVAADQELARAATLFPVREVVKQIIAPIFDQVGERRSEKEFGVAHERLASGLLRNLMGSLFRLCSISDDAETIVLATPAGERNEFGSLLAALLGAAHGWRVVFLGAGVPAAEIANAVRLTNARVLSLSLDTGHIVAHQELEAVSRLLPVSTRVWISGTEAAKHRDLMARANWIFVHDLERLDDLLAG